MINPADHQVRHRPILGGLISQYQLAAGTLPGTGKPAGQRQNSLFEPHISPARATGHFAHRSSLIPLPLSSTLTAQHGGTEKLTVHDRIHSTRPLTSTAGCKTAAELRFCGAGRTRTRALTDPRPADLLRWVWLDDGVLWLVRSGSVLFGTEP